MLKTDFLTFALFAFVMLLAGCAANSDRPPETRAAASAVVADNQRTGELERLLAERQRQCQAEKRRLELSLKEAQKQNEELQNKINALRAIDRELRSREKSR